MYMRFQDGKRKVLTFSYDDGTIFDKRLSEIFDKYGLLGTFNISAGRYHPEEGEDLKERKLKLSEAKELYLNSKHEIALHSYSHPVLTDLKSSDVVREILEDRMEAEKTYQRRITGFAYPYGNTNEEVIKAVKRCGISYARNTVSTEDFWISENLLDFNPTCHHDNPRLFELAEKFVNEKPYLGNWLFYVWGHSVEFERNNNWDRIERFAEYVGRKEDIWYTTNIEIIEYIENYNRLIISADGKKAYNPTVMPLWAEENGEIIKINPGEIFINGRG